MRILFITSSLQPGLDGVGDYTRRLAEELVRQGHAAALLSLHDRHFGTRDSQVDHNNEATQIRILRLSSTLAWSERLTKAKVFIKALKPTHLSLQYVPYGFHAKGLPWRLPYRLKRLSKNHPWHIMFHELWVGLGQKAPLRHQMIGVMQKKIVKRLLGTLEPVLVHTHATPYFEKLQELSRSRVQKLPLFSNISPKGNVTECGKNSELRFAFLGTVHGEWEVDQVSSTLLRFSEPSGEKPVVHAIGNGGNHGPETWAFLRRRGIDVKEHGMLEAAAVSQVLQSCTAGLSASCPDLIEKSSSASAMFEHGLPVLITRPPICGNRYLPKVEENCPLAYFGERLKRVERVPSKKPAKDCLSEIANQFLNDISG